jgi:hypothetical protein
MNDSIPPDEAPDQAAPDPVLEDEHEDPVGSGDRERVEHNRLQRDHDRVLVDRTRRLLRDGDD